jgi:type I restriction enzyme R subunit
MSLSFREELISQIPALQLLMALGYTYLTPEEALVLRGNSEREVLLTGVLAPWLWEHNTIDYRSQEVAFSEANIQIAIRRLSDEPLANGLLAANERVYELLSLGTSLPQTVGDDTRSYSLHYIDWQHPERNVYHISDEFPVQRAGRHDTRRPDIVLFVNGIPLAVIECKRPDLTVGDKKAVQQGISQMLRNQGRDEIPGLFLYPQLLLGVSVNHALYATTGAGKEYWAAWSEQAVDGAGNSRPVDLDPIVAPLINRPLSAEERERLYAWRGPSERLSDGVRTHFEGPGERLPTPQDRARYSLLRPERLLELAYRFIVYDAGTKKGRPLPAVLCRLPDGGASRAPGPHSNPYGGSDLAHHRQRQEPNYGVAGQGAGPAPGHPEPARGDRHRPHQPGRPDHAHLPALRQDGGPGHLRTPPGQPGPQREGGHHHHGDRQVRHDCRTRCPRRRL